MNTPARLPESVSKWEDPFILCALILGVYAVLSPLAVSNVGLAIAIVASIIAVMGIVELWRLPKEEVRYSLRESLPHAFITWLGTLLGLGIVVIVWGTIAEYQRAYYGPFFEMLPIIIAVAPIVSAFFILAADRRQGPSMSGGYQLGLVIVGRLQEVDWQLLRDDLLSWAIRGFFLPINFCELVWSIGAFRGHEVALLSNQWFASEYYLLLMIYALIIAAVTTGYLFGSRLIRTETKSTSHSWFAWTVTLATPEGATNTPFELKDWLP